MITVYSIKGITYIPLETIGEPVEVGREGLLIVNLVRWFVSEILGLLKWPVKVCAFISMFWPGALYG
jgi:hypothetical protein